MSYEHVAINAKVVAMLIMFILGVVMTWAFFYWLYQVWVL